MHVHEISINGFSTEMNYFWRCELNLWIFNANILAPDTINVEMRLVCDQIESSTFTSDVSEIFFIIRRVQFFFLECRKSNFFVQLKSVARVNFPYIILVSCLYVFWNFFVILLSISSFYFLLRFCFIHFYSRFLFYFLIFLSHKFFIGN